MISRRRVVFAFGACALASGAASSVPAFAQQPARVWRIGYFYFGSRKSSVETGRNDAFLRGMRNLGYVEGKTFVLEERYAEGESARLPGLAADLVHSKVDLIVATGSPGYPVLKKATTTIPIVITVGDPISEGIVASLSRPGGNIT